MDYDMLIAELENKKREFSAIWNMLIDDNTIHFDNSPIDPSECMDVIEMMERLKQKILESERYKKWREENFYG